MASSPVKHNQLLSIYQEAIGIIDHGVVWLDREGNIIGVNRQFADELGYPRADLNQKTIFQINPHTNLLHWRKLWTQLQDDGRLYLETEHMTAKGSIFPVGFKGVLVELEGEQFCCGIIENLLESARFHRLLKLTERISRSGSWELDLIKKEILFTEGMLELLGIPAQEVMDENDARDLLKTFLPQQEFDNLLALLKEAAKKGITFDTELNLKLPKRRMRAELRASPITSEGFTHKITGILRDLSAFTERTEALYLMQFCIDHAFSMIYWVREDGKFEYVNKAVCQKLGYSQQELLGMAVMDVDPELTKESWNALWQEAKEQKNLEIERTRRGKDGEIFPVKISLNYVNFHGKEYCLKFAIDLRKKKEREKRIHFAEQTLKQAKDIIYWLDVDGNFLFFNEALSKLSGFSEQELAGMTIRDLFPDYSMTDIKAGWERIKIEKIRSSELEMTCKDGSTIPLESLITITNYEDREVACAILRDIRHRKTQDENIQLSYHTLSQADEMIYWLRKDGRLRYFNNSFCQNLGYTPEEVEQLRELDFYPNLSQQKYESDWETILSGSTISGEYEVLKKDDSILPVEGRFSLIKYAGEELILGILRDITERKQKEAALQKQFEENERLRKKLEEENILLKEEIKLEYSFSNIISKSPNYKTVLQKVEQVADTDTTVLILGETGTGKELLAKAIHQMSNRADRPLVKVNCGALPENLIESELFGHEKGAFTGAYQRKIGRFEAAHHGTIFLDEVGELPLDLQVKLLRVLQEKEFERVGGTQTIRVDVRLIAATNRNLEKLVQAGTFRKDLYYRLNVFPIKNLPLRERLDDIPLLVRHFVEKFNKQLGKNVSEVPQPALQSLMRYDFPGNVRELENLIERAMILSSGKKLLLDLVSTRSELEEDHSFKTMEEMQRVHILEALKRTHGRVSGENGAAELLDMNDKTLTSRMLKLNIHRLDYLKE